jgi:hypothetical protein
MLRAHATANRNWKTFHSMWEEGNPVGPFVRLVQLNEERVSVGHGVNDNEAGVVAGDRSVVMARNLLQLSEMTRITCCTSNYIYMYPRLYTSRIIMYTMQSGKCSR